jgi:hypothetical protein
MKTKNNNLLLSGLVVLLLLIVIGAWYFLASQKPAYVLSADKTAYFTTDKPAVELKLLNAKNAESGRIDFEYDKNILKLSEKTLSTGVQMRELDNKLIFELSKDYFSADTDLLAKLTFDATNVGTVEFKLDKATASLKTNTENLVFDDLKNVTITVGVVPER